MKNTMRTLMCVSAVFAWFGIAFIAIDSIPQEDFQLTPAIIAVSNWTGFQFAKLLCLFCLAYYIMTIMNQVLYLTSPGFWRRVHAQKFALLPDLYRVLGYHRDPQDGYHPFCAYVGKLILTAITFGRYNADAPVEGDCNKEG